MLDLKDFFHLSEVDVLLAQIVSDPRGITVVAGLGPRSAQSTASGLTDASIVSSDRSTIAALLMRQILDHEFNGRLPQATVVGPNRSALPVSNHQRRQVEFISAPIDHVDGFTTGLQQAMMRDPDLLAIDRLNTVTAQATFHAAATGRRVLTQIDTALFGGDVLQEIVGLGCSPSQMSLVSWVVAVQRVPALCSYCKQPHHPSAALVEALTERYNLNRGATFYAASGCDHCQGTGYLGELTAFDIFRIHGGVTSFSELVSAPSLLSLEGYVARLAERGYTPLEDVTRLGRSTPSKTPVTLAAHEPAPDAAARALQRRLAEMEAAGKVLAQRIDELLSLQDFSQRLATASLYEMADRIAHFAREVCGADRTVVYSVDEASGAARILSVAGWEASVVGQMTHLTASLRERGDPESVVGPPPGIDLPLEEVQTLQAGLRVPLTAGASLLGLIIVHSLHKTRFTSGGVALLKMLGEAVAASIQRARETDELRARIEQLEASRSGLVEAARRERELELARELHARLLPDHLPSAAGLEFAVAYRPAPDISCDVYDVFDLGDGWLGVLMADVAGKGLTAAYRMRLARTLIHWAARATRSPRDALAQAGRALAATGGDGVFITAFYGVLEVATHHLVYCRAGHPRPLWLRADGHDVLLGAPGVALGMIDGDELDLAEGEIYLSPGDALIVYVDGMVGALDPFGAEFGVAHWVRRAREHFGLPADRLCAALFDEVAAFQSGAAQTDDMTLLVVRALTTDEIGCG